MVDFLVQAVSWILILIACIFIVSGAVGLVRMPDLYTRLHASSLTDTGGTIVLSLALLLQALYTFDNSMAAIKVVLILFFTLFTSPTSSHALAKTALLCGQVPVDCDGKTLLNSSEEATRLARSRPEGYRHGEDARKIEHQLKTLDKQSKGER